jgi:hypothetical protein
MPKPLRSFRARLALATLALGLPSSIAVAATPPEAATPVYLLNGILDEPYPGTTPGDAVDTPAVCGGATGWASASAAWSTWLNEPLTQATSWLTTSPDGLYTANLVYSGGPGGLVTVLSWSPTDYDPVWQGTETNVNSVGAWVWVVAGGVGIQLGDGGNAGGPNHLSQSQGHWEWIGGCGHPKGLNSEITIYGDGPSIYYVDDVTVSYDPDCDGKSDPGELSVP